MEVGGSMGGMLARAARRVKAALGVRSPFGSRLSVVGTKGLTAQYEKFAQG